MYMVHLLPYNMGVLIYTYLLVLYAVMTSINLIGPISFSTSPPSKECLKIKRQACAWIFLAI